MNKTRFYKVVEEKLYSGIEVAWGRNIVVPGPQSDNNRKN
jgi:hypothetical protein